MSSSGILCSVISQATENKKTCILDTNENCSEVCVDLGNFVVKIALSMWRANHIKRENNNKFKFPREKMNRTAER